MVAERAILPLVININNFYFLGREGVVNVTTTFLTIIETAKMSNLNVKDYLTFVFREIMNGNTDYAGYMPAAF